MAGHLTTRWGWHPVEPRRTKDLTAALTELDVDDPEHPDCWLEDEQGGAYPRLEAGWLFSRMWKRTRARGTCAEFRENKCLSYGVC